jgi:DinB family protein
MEDLRYPVGKFEWQGDIQLGQWVDDIAAAPAQLRAAVSGLSAEQIDTPYRPGGWTVRQVVHHLPDSHMNSYIRFRLALTELEPIVKPYDQECWADLYDSRAAPMEPSLSLLESLHERWVLLLRSLTPADWKRTFRHPELGIVSLERNAGSYAWHGRHHIAHITSLRQRMGWNR